jgi:hypothetical protein
MVLVRSCKGLYKQDLKYVLCHAPVLGYKGNVSLSTKNHLVRKRAFTTVNLNLLFY